MTITESKLKVFDWLVPKPGEIFDYTREAGGPNYIVVEAVDKRQVRCKYIGYIGSEVVYWKLTWWWRELNSGTLMRTRYDPVAISPYVEQLRELAREHEIVKHIGGRLVCPSQG